MDEELRQVSMNIRRIGLGALAHANWHGHYMSVDNDCWSELSIIQATHAVELLIKARIAEENPLLIFDKLPKVRRKNGVRLGLADLARSGRTVQYFDLPDRLWATTGIELAELETYVEVGKIRNAVQHFAPPKEDFSRWTSQLIYDVIDPFINKCWGLYAIDYNEDSEPYLYLVQSVLARGIKFLVSPESVKYFQQNEIDWPPNQDFVQEMKCRITEARNHAE